MDQDLRTLSDEDKKALRQLYATRAPEDRNGRGTLVFLLGRNITSAEDLRFFGMVLEEKACLSLANCSVLLPTEKGEEVHAEMGVALTLAYPQIVAIRSLGRLLRQAGPLAEGSLRSQAIEFLERTKKSDQAVVAKAAAQALHGLKP